MLHDLEYQQIRLAWTFLFQLKLYKNVRQLTLDHHSTETELQKMMKQ